MRSPIRSWMCMSDKEYRQFSVLPAASSLHAVLELTARIHMRILDRIEKSGHCGDYPDALYFLENINVTIIMKMKIMSCKKMKNRL